MFYGSRWNTPLIEERSMDTPKPTDPAKALDKVIKGLELVAGTIIAGTFLVNALTSFFTTEEDSPTPIPDDSPEPTSKKTDWAALGRSILEEKPSGEQNLARYLTRQYLGLYLIGRCGERLSSSEIESLAKDLHHFHIQLNREPDWPLSAWYETVGVLQEIPLSKRLVKSVEVQYLRVNPVYIAYALGEKVSDSLLDFEDFAELQFDIAELQERKLLD